MILSNLPTFSTKRALRAPSVTAQHFCKQYVEKLSIS